MKKTTPKKTHYTITEAAKKLKVSRAAVHKAIQLKRLQHEWGEIIIHKKVLLIPIESIKSYDVSKRHQTAGKKND